MRTGSGAALVWIPIAALVLVATGPRARAQPQDEAPGDDTATPASPAAEPEETGAAPTAPAEAAPPSEPLGPPAVPLGLEPPAPDPSRQSETIVVEGAAPAPVPGRASTRATAEEVRERQPRSAPDALRYEPGVYVQQTSAGQGSAFIRGRTGQQTVLMFDGIRLNNSTYRQGPNQYFFTIDMRSVDSLEVLRGGASTRFGSDALGGILNAVPIDPDPGSLPVRPSAQARATTADDERGGRLQLDAHLRDDLAFVGGVGYRDVGALESGGAVRSPETGEVPQVPRFEDDGRTQLGTGFRELASDARLVFRPRGDQRWTAAVYDYRQFDAPRTDQCPPPFAPRTECLTIDEQFRTLGYLAFEGRFGPAARTLRATLSYQRHRERRTRDRPTSFVQNIGRDVVQTFGTSLQATTASARIPGGELRLRWGADLYHDRISSAAWIVLTDLDYVAQASRGQYLEGSHATTGGAFTEAELRPVEAVAVRAGARLSGTWVDAPGDAASGTSAIDRRWVPVVGHLGAEWRVAPPLALRANLDRSFRTPNLDDLTSRQATGPGFQFENAALDPEVSYTAEAGAALELDRLAVEGWVYSSVLRGAITRAQRNADDCPPETPECRAAWFRYQLVNLDGAATIVGAELAARVELGWGASARGTVAWARGEGPNPQARPTDPSLPYQETVPLSRIPPLNGTAELRWSRRAWSAGAGLRWATVQDRLAPSDRSDERIPQGGTPGFAVLDLRAGYRLGERLFASLVLENLFDAAYRYHGSSINGPGRGLILAVEGSL